MAGLSSLPAISAASFLGLAANSGSPRMSLAPIVHIVMQLLTQS